MSRFRCTTLAWGVGALWVLETVTAQTDGRIRELTVRPQARVATEPVPHKGDAADDPAIWIHPHDPALSLVLGTDKRGGLHAYNMDGSEQQVVAPEARPNNVDVLYDFPLHGRHVDLAVAGVQAESSRGVKVWVIDESTRHLLDVTAQGAIAVFGGQTPYGLCTYHSLRAGRFYAFVTGRNGAVEQVELHPAGQDSIGGTPVRDFAVGSTAEGCVADDESGAFYLAEEAVGIWRFEADPSAGPPRGRLVARVGEHGLVEDVEGLTLYAAGPGRGYLIASSQGNDSYKVYQRGGDNGFVLTIDPAAGQLDDVEHTDGIAATNCPTSRALGRGLFVVQDGHNVAGNQNFKLFGWEDVAGTELALDVKCRVRAGVS
ncbi:MAG TPA: phytase [Gemmatimonadales bacterium]|nr:phytase [Gemmatimonadales bacterium]